MRSRILSAKAFYYEADSDYDQPVRQRGSPCHSPVAGERADRERCGRNSWAWTSSKLSSRNEFSWVVRVKISVPHAI